MRVKENLERIREEIRISSIKSGSGPGDVTLVGITKTFPSELVNEAVRCGLTDVGENRIQEAEKKFPQTPNARKHMVGHLQSNKVSKAIKIFDMIQSVDSPKIAGKISERSLDSGKRMPVLIQVLTDEGKQSGTRPKDIGPFLREVSSLKGIHIQGLMTIGPYFEEPEDSRPVFRQMKQLFDSLKDKIPGAEMRYLSMGMSEDFGIAIEEGANMIRVGRALFGRR